MAKRKLGRGLDSLIGDRNVGVKAGERPAPGGFELPTFTIAGTGPQSCSGARPPRRSIDRVRVAGSAAGPLFPERGRFPAAGGNHTRGCRAHFRTGGGRSTGAVTLAALDRPCAHRPQSRPAAARVPPRRHGVPPKAPSDARECCNRSSSARWGTDTSSSLASVAGVPRASSVFGPYRLA